jgi:hypothetical protein
MTENTSKNQIVHRWYTRPVFFVSDVNRAARFYIEMLGFEKGWHEAEGAGTVCQVNHGECEIIPSPRLSLSRRQPCEWPARSKRSEHCLTTSSMSLMTIAARIAPLLLFAACASVHRQSVRASQVTLPPLSGITHVDIGDAASGGGLAHVRSADSVSAIVALYGRISDGWEDGPARSPQIAATFYSDTGQVASLVLASGAFEARFGGRVLHRQASAGEAFAFAKLTGIRVMHGSKWAVVASAP